MIPALMSEKQKEQLAQIRLIQQHGRAFYKFPISERERLRRVERMRMDAEFSANKQGAKLTTDDIVNATKIVKGIESGEISIIPTPNYGDFPALATSLKPDSPDFDAKTTEAPNNLRPAPTDYKDKPLQPVSAIEPPFERKHEAFALSIELNAKQTLAAEYAEFGKSFAFTGPAGTGKTTACREIARRLLKSGKLGEHDFSLGGGERAFGPSIAFCSFTNRATDNIRRALHKDPELEEILKHNVLTIHKLLEYQPVFYEIFDKESGEMRTTMRFEPQRTAANPLRITHLVIEESSMLGTDLGMKLLEALPKGCQIIYVGDINQLPPIFAKSMLNYALVLLPVVELTEVYRQALESPIIQEAHNCLAGKMLQDHRPYFQVVSGKNVKTIPGEALCVNQLVNSLRSWYDKWEDTKGEQGQQDISVCRKYDPEQDMIISPWNKGECGTNVINSHIAQFLGQKRKAIVYEVYAGMRKLYVAEGDRVMVNKQDGYITKISHNGRYLGKMPRPATTEMTRFGMVMVGNKEAEFEDLELSLSSYAALNVDNLPPEDEKQNQASHVVTVKLDNGAEDTLSTIGDYSESAFSLGYALTVHKAQGCEWRKVFILIHRNQAISLNREMMYTAITRAREFCIIVDLCNMLPRAIANQRIKGNSIEEKIEWFNSEVSLTEPVPVIP